MIISTGKNDFINNTFDKYRWSANTYETPEEIYAYMHEIGVYSKKIKSISAIGATLKGLGFWKGIAAQGLWKAGIIINWSFREGTIDFSDGTTRKINDSLELLKNVRTERSVTLYEPLIITFEDGNTLELQPCAGIGLRIGYNSLPKDMTEGANHSDYDLGVLFNPFIEGKTMYSLNIYSKMSTVYYDGPRDDKVRKRNTYRFSCGLYLEEMQCCEYELSIQDSEYMRCGDLANPQFKSHQSTVIQEGYFHGGHMVIFPSKGLGYDEAPYDIDHSDIFSVFPFVPDLFYPMLTKYFDKSLPVNKEYSHGYFHDYDWNYYTKDAVKQMIDEARTKLEEVCRLPEREWFDQLNIRRSEQSEEELRQEAEEELDYTDRFLNRLLGMTLNTPEYEYIVFLGP